MFQVLGSDDRARSTVGAGPRTGYRAGSISDGPTAAVARHPMRSTNAGSTRQLLGFWNRRQTVAPIPAQLAFHAALLIPFRRIARLALRSPVRAERDDPVGFDALPPTQDLLHPRPHVVVTQGRGTRRRSMRMPTRAPLTARPPVSPRLTSRPEPPGPSRSFAARTPPGRRVPPFVSCRTVTSAMGNSGSCSRNRVQMRCAVCRCFRGACRSASSIRSIASFKGRIFGCVRSCVFRSRGIGLAIAWRTIHRCTPDFVNHIDYVVKFIEIDHVGISSDFDGGDFDGCE
jgi:Membrane dipeptidase (Peptidase family M19)